MVHILFAIIVFIALVGRNKDKTILRIAFLLLFLFAALRYMFGNDYSSYLAEYIRIRNGKTDVFELEYLYTFLNLVSPTFYVLVAVTSLAFVYCIYCILTRNLPRAYVWVGLLIFLINPYLFLMNLSAMRQCLAMVLFIVAVNFAAKRKPVLYVLLILTAVLFHKSAILLLPFYFFADSRQVKKGTIFAVLAVLFLGLYVIDVQTVAIFMAEWFGDSQYIHHVSGEGQNSLRATLLTTVYFIFVLMNLPKLKGKALVYGKLYLVGTMLGVLAYRMSMLTRIQMYFDIFSVVVIPSILIELRKEGRVRVDPRHPVASVWVCINHYVLPILVFMIYVLRYYSFFTNPLWEPFMEYRTIFELIN